MSVLVLDPGNSTGWVFEGSGNGLVGGTVRENHADVADLLKQLNPDTVVYETFQMYPGKAQKLIWNTFYPCEVIGVIKCYCQTNNIPIVGLQPSVKKFALAPHEQDSWKRVAIVDNTGKATEHTRDAYRLYMYYVRNYQAK